MNMSSRVQPYNKEGLDIWMVFVKKRERESRECNTCRIVFAWLINWYIRAGLFLICNIFHKDQALKVL